MITEKSLEKTEGGKHHEWKAKDTCYVLYQLVYLQ